MTGGLNPATAASALAYGLSSSPRVVGEVAHATGRAVAPAVEAARTIARYTPKSGLPIASLAAFQMGRASSVANEGEEKRKVRAGADYLMGLATAP